MNPLGSSGGLGRKRTDPDGSGRTFSHLLPNHVVFLVFLGKKWVIFLVSQRKIIICIATSIIGDQSHSELQGNWECLRLKFSFMYRRRQENRNSRKMEKQTFRVRILLPTSVAYLTSMYVFNFDFVHIHQHIPWDLSYNSGNAKLKYAKVTSWSIQRPLDVLCCLNVYGSNLSVHVRMLYRWGIMLLMVLMFN